MLWWSNNVFSSEKRVDLAMFLPQDELENVLVNIGRLEGELRSRKWLKWEKT